MKIVRSKEFRADRAWGALDIAKMNGITTRLHWTDQPYRWHVNDGEEVFAVLDGLVEMRYRQDGEEFRTLLRAGDLFLRRHRLRARGAPAGRGAHPGDRKGRLGLTQAGAPPARRRRDAARPASPSASSATEAGSGTACRTSKVST